MDAETDADKDADAVGIAISTCLSWFSVLYPNQEIWPSASVSQEMYWLQCIWNEI